MSMERIASAFHALPLICRELLADRKLVTITREYYRRADRIDHLEMNVECRARREGSEISKQVFSTGAPRISDDILGSRSFAKGQPARARAIVVDVGIDGPLQPVGSIGSEVAHPHIEINDPVGVVGLAKLHESEPAATQNDLIIEMRRFRSPGRRSLKRRRSRRRSFGIRSLVARASGEKQNGEVD